MSDIPNKIEKFKALESDLSTSIAQALWQKAASICEYVSLSYPVGMLIFVNSSQAALPSLPDAKYWQYADGSVVTNTNSPLLGQTLPDLRGKFFKHPATGQIENVVEGADSAVLNHDHTGLTGFATDYDSVRLDNGGDKGQAIGSHQHTISNATITVDNIPAHFEVQVYVRIV